MSSVKGLKFTVNKLECDIRELENKIEWIDVEKRELESEKLRIIDTITKRQFKLHKLTKELEIAKENSKPLKGQIALV